MKLYAYIVTDETGEKRILSIPTKDGELPLVANNVEELSKREFRDLARGMRNRGQVVELISFSKATVLERYD